MTNDEIKHLMREQWATAILLDADVERIRNIIEAAVLAERERCLDIIETHRIPIGQSPAGEMAQEWTYNALKDCAAAIRARG